MRNSIFYPVVLSLACLQFIGPGVAAAAASAMRLDWVLERVRDANPEVRAAFSEVEAASAKVSSSRAWPDPQIGVEFWDIPRPGLDFQAADSKWLDISQEIPFPAKTMLQSQVATHAMLLERMDAEKVLQDQCLLAKQAYWDLYAASSSLRAVSKTAEALHEMAALSSHRLRAGQSGRMEQLMDSMLTMETAGLENQALGLSQQRTDARARLAQLLGGEIPDGIGDPQGRPPELADAVTEEGILERALAGRPALLEARHHRLHLEAQRDLQEAGWFPDLMLQYSLVENTDGPQDSMAMAKLTLPFVWFWRQEADVRFARAEVDAATAMERAAEDETRAMVKSEMAAWRTARRQLEKERLEILPSADEALELGRSGFKSGSISAPDALGAVKAYLMAQEEAAGLEAQVGRSSADLESLVGGSLDAAPSNEAGHGHH